MFWKEKEKKQPTDTVVKPGKKNSLTITMNDKSTLSWVIDGWVQNDKTKPWRAFYKWFFGRTGDTFVMRYINGETMFRREDIKRFTVQVD